MNQTAEKIQLGHFLNDRIKQKKVSFINKEREREREKLRTGKLNNKY